MSDDLSPLEEAIAAGSGGDVEPEQPAQPEVEVEASEESPAQELILGKFKSYDDLAKSYTELENKLRSGEHKQPEPEEEREPEPFDWIPPHVSDETLQRIAMAFNQDPVQAAVDLARNPQILGPQATSQLLREFAKDDPWSAAAAQAKLTIPQPSQEPSRAEAWVDQQQTSAVAHWARNELPDFEKYEERIHQVLTGEHAEYYAQFIEPGNPDSYANIVRSIYRDLALTDFEQARREQAQQAEAPAQQVPAAKRTATKNTAQRGNTNTTAQDIEDLIANARV
jgi:hypothetical protein